MSAIRRSLTACLACALALVMAGCAHPVAAPSTRQAGNYWHGRLALRVDTAEPTSFFASFELSGQADAGELTLSSPMGTTLAQLRWSPQFAILRSDGRTRAFNSLDALAIEATGTDIPIPALFEWLRGQPAAADGWLADLSQLAEGRLLAQRTLPAPAAELRLILEP